MDQQRGDEFHAASVGISRRDFLGGSGALAAASVAAGLSVFARDSAAQTSTAETRAVRLGFTLPGTPEVGTLVMAQGGGIRLEPLATGGLAMAADPVTITFSSQMARPFFEWFNVAARPSVNTAGRDVQIIGANASNARVYALTLFGARVARFGWTTLAVNTSEVVLFAATLVPRSAGYQYFGGQGFTSPDTPARAPVTTAHFRFSIQGLEKDAAQVTRIDGLTRHLMPLPGADTAAVSNEPMRVLLPPPAAAGFYRWQAESLAARGAERSGVLQFLSSDRTAVVGQVYLSGLSIQAIDVAPASVAGGVRVSLNCRAVEFDKASFF
jgi:hypothetical protein